MATLFVGIGFAAILLWALNRSRKDLKSNQCAGCSKTNCPSRTKRKE